MMGGPCYFIIQCVKIVKNEVFYKCMLYLLIWEGKTFYKPSGGG